MGTTETVEQKEPIASDVPSSDKSQSTTIEKPEETEPAKNLPEAEQEDLPDKVPEHVKTPHQNTRLPTGNRLPSGTTEKSEVTEPAEKLPESEPKDLLAQELEDVELPHRHIRLPSGIRIVKYLGPKDIVVEPIAPIPIEESSGGIRKNTTEKVQLIDLIIGDEEETSET